MKRMRRCNMDDSDWRSYGHGRVIRKHSSGFFVIKPAELTARAPTYCGMCGVVMRTEDDEDSWKKFECCSLCARTWVYPHRKEWNEGWRPDPSDVRALAIVNAVMTFDEHPT
jgi:hypothetical protein